MQQPHRNLLVVCVSVTPCRKVGDPFKPDTQHGPQINSNQLDKIRGYAEEVSLLAVTAGQSIGGALL